jgi:hypothetical protein
MMVSLVSREYVQPSVHGKWGQSGWSPNSISYSRTCSVPNRTRLCSTEINVAPEVDAADDLNGNSCKDDDSKCRLLMVELVLSPTIGKSCHPNVTTRDEDDDDDNVGAFVVGMPVVAAIAVLFDAVVVVDVVQDDNCVH